MAKEAYINAVREGVLTFHNPELTKHNEALKAAIQPHSLAERQRIAEENKPDPNFVPTPDEEDYPGALVLLLSGKPKGADGAVVPLASHNGIPKINLPQRRSNHDYTALKATESGNERHLGAAAIARPLMSGAGQAHSPKGGVGHRSVQHLKM